MPDNRTTFFVDTVEADSPTAKRHRIRRCEMDSEEAVRRALGSDGDQFFPGFNMAVAGVREKLLQRVRWLTAQMRQAKYNLDQLDSLYRTEDTLESELKGCYQQLVDVFGRTRMRPGDYLVGPIAVHAQELGEVTMFVIDLDQSPLCPVLFDRASCSTLSQAMQEVGYRIARHTLGPGHASWRVFARLPSAQ